MTVTQTSDQALEDGTKEGAGMMICPGEEILETGREGGRMTGGGGEMVMTGRGETRRKGDGARRGSTVLMIEGHEVLAEVSML